MPSTASKLSDHQRRVIAAILALESEHAWQWWARASIGDVVGAGGFHSTIQITTMHILRSHGLVCTLRSVLPPEVRKYIRCWCPCGVWGLTDQGRKLAEKMAVRWSDAARQRVARCRVDAMDCCVRDEGDGRYRDDDDLGRRRRSVPRR